MPTDVQLTTPGMVLGSPHFISPERAMGSDFGPPSDLFSLGVTLYTAIEGRPPFDKGDPIETMHAVVEDPPTPAVRAGSLTQVLMGLLEKDPARRFDVQTARTMLRQQLAGPLASKAPPHMMTDPYSVVPSQRPPAAETQPIPPPEQPKPTGQIGGRAMLAPGESLTGRLAKLKQGGTGGGRRRAPEAAAASQPTGAYPPPPSLDSNRTSVIPSSAASESDETSVLPPRRQWDGARAARDPLPGTVVVSPAAKRRAMIDKTVATVRESTEKAVTTVKGWPRNTQLIAGGGALAVVVVLVLVFSLTGGNDAAPPDAPGNAGDQIVPAAFDTQDYKGDKSVTVKVPKGWSRAASGNWVDYADPENKSTKVRVLVEPGSIAPRKFAETTAPATLKKSKACPKPFTHLGTTDVEVSGLPGAEFQYTCGSGDTMRHGIWRQTTTGGKMYSFYLTTTEAQFADSKQYFDEMAETFTLKAS
jgi:hypothetical protein